MVERIIEFSAKNRGLVLLLTAITIPGAVWTTKHIPLDAIPDLSDTQVIIYSRLDRSPDILEDQVTYPIATALLGAPRIKAVRRFRISGTPTSTSSSRTGRTFTGRDRVCSST